MKKLLFAIGILIFANAIGQPSLEKIWESDSSLRTPESVLYHEASKTMYVSNIGDFQTENSGFISKMNAEGKIINTAWVTGLTAAKGLGLHNNLLYVAEQNTVAVIDIRAGKILRRIAIEDAQMLNDITIDAEGIVYVSDTREGKIHRIDEGTPSVFLKDLKSPNGLLSVGEELYILADGKLMKADKNKSLSVLAEGMEGGVDGIEMVREHEFLVSGWQGLLYYVKSDGSKLVLLDTRDKKINTADIGYDAINKIVYVPTFGNNRVVAYRLIWRH